MCRKLALIIGTLALTAETAAGQEAYRTISGSMLDNLVAAGERAQATDEPVEEVETSGSFGLRTGYDSNYDSLIDEDDPIGGMFAEYSGDGEVIREFGPLALFADGDAVVGLIQDDLQPVRAEGSGRLGLRLTPITGVALDLAAGEAIDATDDPVTLDAERAAMLTIAQDAFTAGLRYGYNSTRPVSGLYRAGDFDPLDDAEDTTTLDASLLLLPNEKLSPLIEVATYRTTSLASDPSIGDYGDDHRMETALLGLRLKPAEELEILAGWRLMRRIADDPLVGTLEHSAAELSAEWRPLEHWRVAASLRSELDAPTVNDSPGLVATTVSGAVRYDPDEGFGWALKGSHETDVETGVDIRDTVLKAQLDLNYRWDKMWYAQASFSKEIEAGEDYFDVTNRLVISSGAEVSF